MSGFEQLLLALLGLADLLLGRLLLAALVEVLDDHADKHVEDEEADDEEEGDEEEDEPLVVVPLGLKEGIVRNTHLLQYYEMSLVTLQKITNFRSMTKFFL